MPSAGRTRLRARRTVLDRSRRSRRRPPRGAPSSPARAVGSFPHCGSDGDEPVGGRRDDRRRVPAVLPSKPTRSSRRSSSGRNTTRAVHASGAIQVVGGRPHAAVKLQHLCVGQLGVLDLPRRYLFVIQLAGFASFIASMSWGSMVGASYSHTNAAPRASVPPRGPARAPHPRRQRCVEDRAEDRVVPLACLARRRDREHLRSDLGPHHPTSSAAYARRRLRRRPHRQLVAHDDASGVYPYRRSRGRCQADDDPHTVLADDLPGVIPNPQEPRQLLAPPHEPARRIEQTARLPVGRRAPRRISGLTRMTSGAGTAPTPPKWRLPALPRATITTDRHTGHPSDRTRGSRPSSGVAGLERELAALPSGPRSGQERPAERRRSGRPQTPSRRSARRLRGDGPLSGSAPTTKGANVSLQEELVALIRLQVGGSPLGDAAVQGAHGGGGQAGR